MAGTTVTFMRSKKLFSPRNLPNQLAMITTPSKAPKNMGEKVKAISGSGVLPSVSVVVFAYNRQRYLPYALRSLSAQTIPTSMFQVVVARNFREPVSDRIIKENGWVDLQLEDATQAVWLAEALKRVSGDVVCFLEDDDLFEPVKLERVRELFNDLTIGYLTSDMWLIGERDAGLGLPATRLKRVDTRVEASCDNDQEMADFYTMVFWCNVSSTAIRRSLVTSRIDLLIKISTFIDPFLFLCLAGLHTKAVYTPEPLGGYRIYPENSSNPIKWKLTKTNVEKIKRLKSKIADDDALFLQAAGPKLRMCLLRAIVMDRLFALQLTKGGAGQKLRLSFNYIVLTVLLRRKDFGAVIGPLASILFPGLVRKRVFRG